MQFLTVLAGASFLPREARDALMMAEAGTRLTLVREPSNQWDANAVKVILDDGETQHHVGYVARTDNMDIATLLDNEYAVAQGLAAEGHTPTVDRCEILDFASGSLKPTIVIEISTGFEVGTQVKGPDLDGSGELDPMPREGE